MARGDRQEYTANQVLSMAYDEDDEFIYVGLATQIAGEDLTANVMKTEQRSSYTNLTADTAVKTGAGRLFGIFVASASATPTIKLWDNTAGSGTVLVNTFTPVAATYYPFPGVEFSTGLFVDVGGTVDITVFYK